MAPRRLRDLIKAVRGCKTAAEERALVQKEGAEIRQYFRNEDKDYRARNVAKLLYIYMLGYPAHFGQMECLKLITSPRFSDKRIGYFGTTMLLDEGKEIHLLVTNSLKQDMNNQSQYVAGLSLSAFGSIASAEMARDLAGEIEKLIKSSNSFIRKKALLCALRAIRKDDDLVENFIPATRSLLSERNHAVLVTGIALMTEMASLNNECLVHFRRVVPTLVRMLKNLMTSGYSSEYDVNGVTDPFLQVNILRLMRVLGRGDEESSEAMNDILAEVATNTSSTSTSGNAVLYEAVQCIMEIQAESGLQVLATNTLGKFLTNSDRNIRYVALNTLLHTLQLGQSSEAIQRHRETVLDCLREPDVTIRRRALALAFALINQSNVEDLVSELILFLGICDADMRSYVSTELMIASEKFSPSARWHVDTVIDILLRAGNHLLEDSMVQAVQVIAEATDVHQYAVQRLYSALQQDISQQPTAQVGLWCLGEFADLLVASSFVPHNETDAISVSSKDVLELVKRVLQSSTSSRVTQEYALTTLMKLTARLPDLLVEIRPIIASYGRSMDEELQQRAAEYVTIFKGFDNMRPALLETMPVSESRTRNVVGNAPTAQPVAVSAPQDGGSGDLLDLLSDSAPTPSTGGGVMANGGAADLLGGLDFGSNNTGGSAPLQQSGSGGGGDLLDLLGGGGSSSAPASASQPAPSGGGIDDLLGGLMGGSSTSGSTAPVSTLPSSSMGGGLDDLLGGMSSSTTSSANVGNDTFDLLGGGSSAGGLASAQTPPGELKYDLDDIQIYFQLQSQPGAASLSMSAINKGSTSVSDFGIQVAVPKALQIQLDMPSGSQLEANSANIVTQGAKINNPQNLAIRLLVRVSYTKNGQNVVHQQQVSNF